MKNLMNRWFTTDTWHNVMAYADNMRYGLFKILVTCAFFLTLIYVPTKWMLERYTDGSYNAYLPLCLLGAFIGLVQFVKSRPRIIFLVSIIALTFVIPAALYSLFNFDLFGVFILLLWAYFFFPRPDNGKEPLSVRFFNSGYATSGDIKDLTRAIREQNDRNR